MKHRAENLESAESEVKFGCVGGAAGMPWRGGREIQRTAEEGTALLQMSLKAARRGSGQGGTVWVIPLHSSVVRSSDLSL